MQSRPAFTLLETTISLAIVCSMALIASYNLHDYQAKIEEQQALEWFKNNLKGMFNYCYLNHESAVLYIDPSDHSIEIAPDNKLDSPRYQKRIFPKSLKFNSNSNLKYSIYKAGQASSITISFNSDLTHQKYHYVIQTGWGEIIESKT